MYSQNKEEEIILQFFGDRKGTLLSIGENDGQTLSNSLRLIELGWNAVLVEPSPVAFSKMMRLHKDRKSHIICVNAAVADKEGVFSFYESGTHLKQGDTALLSTLDPEEMKRWEKSGEQFQEIKVNVINYAGLLELAQPLNTFDFITIDAEGVDMSILKQIDLSETQLICVEWNLDLENKAKIQNYCSSFGLNEVIYECAENLIIART
jgi:FkbM family methyltransferase